MANKHRKLFPTSSSNETVDCADICEPTCPYGCYPYPDFALLPPLPPLLPPPAAAAEVTNKGQHVSPYVILIVSLLASLFLLVSYYVIIVKYCSGCSRFRRRSPRSNGPDEDLINEIHGPAIDHPIWYITTVGLQSSVINSITIFKYKKGDNLVEGTDCSVCLNEFQEDETLRLLPKCNHTFHLPCIDTWLRSHTNCPLCRAGIVPNIGNNDAGFPPNDTNSSVLMVNEDTQVENLGNGGGLGENLVSEVEVCENRGSTGGIDIPLFDDERKEIGDFKTDLVSNGKGIFGGIANSCQNDAIQTMRRSYSVDLDSIADVVIDFGSEKSEGSSGNPRVDGLKDEIQAPYLGQQRGFSKTGGSSIEESLHKRPVPMKRSFSCSGRSFLSRQYRSQNTILPL